jgi:hypothetical protein
VVPAHVSLTVNSATCLTSRHGVTNSVLGSDFSGPVLAALGINKLTEFPDTFLQFYFSVQSYLPFLHMYTDFEI